jgi:hypothetical protein
MDAYAPLPIVRDMTRKGRSVGRGAIWDCFGISTFDRCFAGKTSYIRRLQRHRERFNARNRQNAGYMECTRRM